MRFTLLLAWFAPVIGCAHQRPPLPHPPPVAVAAALPTATATEPAPATAGEPTTTSEAALYTADEDQQIAVLERARDLLVTFIETAGDAPEYAEAVARSRDRIEDIGATIDFLNESKRARLAGE